MISLLWNTLSLATPLVLAAIAGYFSERAGVINIALEGKMLLAACLGAVVGAFQGTAAGIFSAIAAALVLSMLHAVATQVYRLDHVVSGMAVNALAAGASNFILERYGKEILNRPLELGPIGIYQALAIAAVILAFGISRYTKAGLRLMAVGSDPFKARLAGIRPVPIRFWALGMTGIFTGLAGLFLVANTGQFSDNMTAGRGYIALAALILGGWRPIPTFVACFVFAFFSSMSIQFQGADLSITQIKVGVTGANPAAFQIPTEFWTAIPYLVTLIALAIRFGKTSAPAGLGRY